MAKVSVKPLNKLIRRYFYLTVFRETNEPLCGAWSFFRSIALFVLVFHIICGAAMQNSRLVLSGMAWRGQDPVDHK